MNLEEYVEFLKDFKYCGTNEPVRSMSFIERVKNGVDIALKGSRGNLDLPLIEVISEGNRRIARPLIYTPEMDFSDGVGHYKLGFEFSPDTLTIVKFRPYQLEDSNTFYRATGVRNSEGEQVRFRLDLTESGAIFEWDGAYAKAELPQKHLDWLKKNNPLILNWLEDWIFKFNHNLFLLKTRYKNYIIPNEREKMGWRNVANRATQFNDVGGMAQYQKMIDGISTGNFPKAQLMPKIPIDDEL